MQTRRRKPAAEKRKPNVDPKKLPPG